MMRLCLTALLFVCAFPLVCVAALETKISNDECAVLSSLADAAFVALATEDGMRMADDSEILTRSATGATGVTGGYDRGTVVTGHSLPMLLLTSIKCALEYHRDTWIMHDQPYMHHFEEKQCAVLFSDEHCCTEEEVEPDSEAAVFISGHWTSAVRSAVQWHSGVRAHLDTSDRIIATQPQLLQGGKPMPPMFTWRDEAQAHRARGCRLRRERQSKSDLQLQLLLAIQLPVESATGTAAEGSDVSPRTTSVIHSVGRAVQLSSFFANATRFMHDHLASLDTPIRELTDARTQLTDFLRLHELKWRGDGAETTPPPATGEWMSLVLRLQQWLPDASPSAALNRVYSWSPVDASASPTMIAARSVLDEVIAPAAQAATIMGVLQEQLQAQRLKAVKEKERFERVSTQPPPARRSSSRRFSCSLVLVLRRMGTRRVW